MQNFAQVFCLSKHVVQRYLGLAVRIPVVWSLYSEMSPEACLVLSQKCCKFTRSEYKNSMITARKSRLVNAFVVRMQQKKQSLSHRASYGSSHFYRSSPSNRLREFCWVKHLLFSAHALLNRTNNAISIVRRKAKSPA